MINKYKIYLISFLIIGILAVNIAIFASAHGEEDFAQAEEIIKQKISCSNLSEEQLEILGEYYMEQMHPGELHEQMDEMMGGEGSASLKQIHVSMGKAFYCGEHDAMSTGMMSMMMGRGMMGYGGMGSGMMQNYRYNNLWALTWVMALLIVMLIVILIYLIIKNKK
ncbi:hypothetical protein HYV49_01905 [Candidatus Pacearchaeota archaeon]|nr:hypothetical protein [Candidatus Pacearchaeota archaeon]